MGLTSSGEEESQRPSLRSEMFLLGLKKYRSLLEGAWRCLRARNKDRLGLQELTAAPDWCSLSKPQDLKCTNDHMTLEGGPELHTCTLNRDLRLVTQGTDCQVSRCRCRSELWEFVGLLTQHWTQGHLMIPAVPESRTWGLQGHREQEAELRSAHAHFSQFY